jgi:hypothetical protein
MLATLGSLLDARSRSIVGRDRERAALMALVDADRPLVAALHGIAGIGKTTLVEAFAGDARAAGAAVVQLDAREIEPTERGFLAHVAHALGRPEAPLAETAHALGDLGERVVLIVDTFEQLGLLDSWLSRTFVPALPLNVRVLLAGRERPSSAWVRGYGDLLATARLHNLAAPDAEAWLRDAGVDPGVNRVAHGHPLTLQLAASALRDRPAADVEGAAFDAVVEEVARAYLDALDPATREALDAASVVRRTTLSLLDEMLPGQPAADAFGRLRALPFVELGTDGLIVHDTMRSITSMLLRAADPATHRRYRVAAWNRLRSELRAASHTELWRYTADVIYLVETPVVRSFFFPGTVLDCAAEPACPEDWPAIEALARAEREVDMTHLEDWWRARPEAFKVVRQADGRVVGFRCLVERDDVSADLARRDPLVARWREHLRDDPVPRGGRVLFLRYVATETHRETPSSALAALLLEVTSSLFAMRPELRRTYAPAPPVAGVDGKCAMAFGYVPLPGEPDDRPFGDRSMYNDLGPGSLDGWLADVAARELLVDDGDGAVDPVRRELRLDGERIDLTQLEFDVLRYLEQHEGRPVRRDALLRNVWGYEWTGGSNVVEVAISALRKKLGARAAALRTVRGVGYALDPIA